MSGVRLVIKVPPELYDQLYAQSQRQGVPMATIYRRALLDKLARDEIVGSEPAMKEAAE